MSDTPIDAAHRLLNEVDLTTKYAYSNQSLDSFEDDVESVARALLAAGEREQALRTEIRDLRAALDIFHGDWAKRGDEMCVHATADDIAAIRDALAAPSSGQEEIIERIRGTAPRPPRMVCEDCGGSGHLECSYMPPDGRRR